MICSSLGNPIQVDYATASRSRISFARVCVEIDITKPPVEEFVIDMAGTEIRQKAVWDKIPRYCADCKHVGHLPESCYAFGRNACPAKKTAPQARAPAPRAKGVPRDPPVAHGASASAAPSQAPHASSGTGHQARAPGENPVLPPPRSPPRGQGHPGRPEPLHGASSAPAPSKSLLSGSPSGLRPLRMGERLPRSSSRSPSRAPGAPSSPPRAPTASRASGAPMAPRAHGAPSSPPRAPKASEASMVAGTRGTPRSPSRVSGEPHRRRSSPRSPGHASPGASLGAWIEVAHSKHKMSARDNVVNVPTKNAFVVLNDGTEVLETEYETEDDRDVEMSDGSRDVSMSNVQGSSIPNRGRVLPDSLGGNLRSGITAPASS